MQIIHKIIELAEIEDREARDLVPYSLRHFMITQRIMSGLNFKQIADMCGTSVMQMLPKIVAKQLSKIN